MTFISDLLCAVPAAWSLLEGLTERGRAFRSRQQMSRFLELEIHWSSPDVVEGYRSGQSTILRAIYRRYVRLVDTIIQNGFVTKGGVKFRGVPSVEARLDLRQDIFLKVFSPRSRRTFDPTRNYGYYITAVARNAMIDLAKRRSAAARTLRSLEKITPCNADYETLTQREQALARVEEYVRTLPMNLRTVFESRFVYKLSQDETARKMNISRQTVRTLESRLKNGFWHQ